MESKENGCNPWSELLEAMCSTDGFVMVLLGGLTKEECKTSCNAKEGKNSLLKQITGITYILEYTDGTNA